MDQHRVSKAKVNLKRYKTRLCKAMSERGCCPMDERCAFAHSDAELRTVEMNLADPPTNVPLPLKVLSSFRCARHDRWWCPDETLTPPPAAANHEPPRIAPDNSTST